MRLTTPAFVLAALLGSAPIWAQNATRVEVYKSPSCECCGRWIDHMQKNGFKVEAHAKNAVSPHRKIVAALQKRDANAAQRSMKDHMFKTLEDISLGAGK